MRKALCGNCLKPVCYVLSVRSTPPPLRLALPLVSPAYFLTCFCRLSWLDEQRFGPGQRNLITTIGRAPVLSLRLVCTQPLFTTPMNNPPLTNVRLSFSLFQFPFLPCQIPPLLTKSGPLVSLSYRAGGKYHCGPNIVLINTYGTSPL